MSSFLAKFTALKTLVLADNTAGAGLNATDGIDHSNAFLRDFVMQEDQIRVRGASGPWGEVEDASVEDEGPMGKQFDVGLLNVHFFTNRDSDRDFTRMEAILLRFRQVVHPWGTTNGLVPAPIGPWKFTSIRWRRAFKGPSTDEFNHRIVQLVLGASGGN